MRKLLAGLTVLAAILTALLLVAPAQALVPYDGGCVHPYPAFNECATGSFVPPGTSIFTVQSEADNNGYFYAPGTLTSVHLYEYANGSYGYGTRDGGVFTDDSAFPVFNGTSPMTTWCVYAVWDGTGSLVTGSVYCNKV